MDNKLSTNSGTTMEDSRQSLSYIVVYGILSFFTVILVALLLYAACVRKYRLNWFERNLLETAETKELVQSEEALVCIQDSQPGSSRSLYHPSSSPPLDDKFWVPQNLNRHSLCHSDLGDTSQEDSLPASPTSSGSFQAFCEVRGNGSSQAVPIARSDKHVVLTSASPIRPKLASMQSKLDHTKIDTSLYQKESSTEPEEVRGSIHVSINYDPIAGILTIRLIEAQDLQARDFSGTADPYAKVRLLPDKTNIWQTRIHKKTLNPVFDEDFVFEVSPAILPRKTLEVLLYDFDAYSRHHSIGGAQICLSTIDLSDRVDIWKGLGPLLGSNSRADLGELMVSLAYLPSAERLTIVIIKARNLRVVDDTRTSSDPYVKVSLLQGTKRLKKKKTGVHRNTICPIFNEAITFDIKKDAFKKCCVEFCVMHDSLLGASELLGMCRIGRGQECRPEERKFFAEIMRNSKTATAQWLYLSDPRNPSD